MELDEEAIAKLEQLTHGLRSGELDNRLIAYKSRLRPRCNYPDENLFYLLYDLPVFPENSDAAIENHAESTRHREKINQTR